MKIEAYGTNSDLLSSSWRDELINDSAIEDRGLENMCELAEKRTDDPKIDRIIFFEHTCGAQDERECTLMKHIIMAEIRKSNVPSWVSEELEKKLDCRGCWNALGRRPAASSLKILS